MDPMNIVDQELLKEIAFFFNKINERALYLMGVYDSYDDGGEPALGVNVEYFHPQITLDDRMVYIAKHIVLAPISQPNVICNTIISHFYGARGIHQAITRIKDPDTALVDFERLLVDDEYRNKIRKNMEDAQKYKIPLYGATELRTSLFGAANKFSMEKYGIKNTHPINILEWVAGFIPRGIVKGMSESNSLKELFNVLIKIEGVGSYYGYHCSTSNSVNPAINVNHDERFCVPGPGSSRTVNMMFPGVSRKELSYGDRVIWFRENQEKLIGKIFLHPSTYNVVVNGRKVLKEDQTELKTYGCEVGLCQFGIYHRLKGNPEMANRRKVSRMDESVLDDFFGAS